MDINAVGGRVVDAAFPVHREVEPGFLEPAPVHKKQLFTCPRLSGYPLVLLRNFGGEFLKGNVERMAAGTFPDLKSASVSSASFV